MSGNRNKNKKEEMDNPEARISKSPNTSNNEQETIKNKYHTNELELVDRLSPKVRKDIEAAFLSMERISRPLLSPLDSKINERHIDKILEIKEKYGDTLFKDTQQSRRFQLAYVLIGVSVFIFLTLLLVGKDTELFKEIIKLFVAFAGGMGVGFGIKSHINNN